MESDSRTTNHHGIFQFQGITQLIIGVNNGFFTLLAIARGNIILATTMRAFFEANTVRALFRVLVVRRSRLLPLAAPHSLTTPPITLHHLPLFICFTPINIGKPTAGAKHLYRLTVGIGLPLANFWMI